MTTDVSNKLDPDVLQPTGAAGDDAGDFLRKGINALPRVDPRIADPAAERTARLAAVARQTKKEREPDRQLDIARLLPPDLGEPRRSFLTALPTTRHRRTGRRWSFILMVILPTVGVGLYNFFVASKVYVSDFRFSVTEVSQATPGQPSAPPTGGGSQSPISSLLGGFGMSGASGQNYIVTDYIGSRQALQELNKTFDVKAAFSRPGVDWWQRFRSNGSTEELAAFWKKMVSANYDPVTGIATAEVKAFTPGDAYKMANTLVELSEKLVNGIELRTQQDSIRFAEAQVKLAEARLKKARSEMLAFRTTQGVIDPTPSAVSTNIDLIKQLRGQDVQYRQQLDTLVSQGVSANAPMARTLRATLSANRMQLNRMEREVSRDSKGAEALARTVGRYEALDVDRQYAQSMVVSSMQLLDQAKANAAAQHLYLTPYVRPNTPQEPAYPQPVWSTFVALLTFFGSWLCLTTVYRSVRDHAV